MPSNDREYRINVVMFRVFVVLMCVATVWYMVQQINGYITQTIYLQQANTYQQQARKLIVEMHEIMISSEDINKTTMDVWHDANYLYSQRQSSSNTQLPYDRWNRVIKVNLATATKSTKDETRKYMWVLGTGYLDEDQAITNLKADPKYKAQKEKLKPKVLAVAKAIRMLNPTDRSEISYQKILRTYAYFEQYIDQTMQPMGNYFYQVTSLNALSMQYMQLYRELDIEIPVR